jgi:hypothetical protein
VANLLFIEEHITAILPELTAARAHVDAFVGMIADPQIVKLTRMGDLDMSQPASGAMALLKKAAREPRRPRPRRGEKQMSMLRRLPKILKYIPGKSQDLRAWFPVDAVLAGRVRRQYRGDDPLSGRPLCSPEPRLARRSRRRPRSNTPRSGFITPTCPPASPPTPLACPARKAPPPPWAS